MALGRMPVLTGARTATDRPVPTQAILRGFGHDLGPLRPVRNLTLRPRCGGGFDAPGLRRLVAGFAHGTHVVHLAHRRVTHMTLGANPRILAPWRRGTVTSPVGHSI